MKYSAIAFRYRVSLLIKLKMTTRRDLAERLGESVSSIGEKLNGVCRFSIDNACRIAEMFDMTFDELFSSDMSDILEMEEELSKMRVANARSASAHPVPRMRYEDRVINDIERYSFMAGEDAADFSSFFEN